MNSDSTKYYSNKQESMISNYLGWTKVPASGALMKPGDIYSDEYLGECKTHMISGVPVSFNIDVWTKLKREAMSQFRRPVYFSDDGSQQIQNTWVILDNVRSSVSIYSSDELRVRNLFKFNSTDMKKKLGTVRNRPACISSSIGNETVYVMSVSDFKNMIEDY